MSEMVLLGDEAVALACGARRADGRLRLPGHAVHRDSRVPDPVRPHARRPPRRVVRQREDGVRGGPRRLLRRPPHAGGDEARRPERRRRPVHELGAGHDQRRPGRGRGRRPGHAQFAERAGQPVLRRLRARRLPRADVAPGGVRDDARGVRRLRALPHPRHDPPGDAPGPQPRHRAGRGGARREPAAQAPQPSAWILLPGNARREWRALLDRRRHPGVRAASRFNAVEGDATAASASSRPASRATTSSRTSTTCRAARAPAHRCVSVPGRHDPRIRRAAAARAGPRRGLPLRRARAARHRAAGASTSRDASPARCRRTAN